MSIQVQKDVWKESRANGSALLVLLAIAEHAHDDGQNAWPSVERLARMTRMSTRHVRRCIGKLVELGEIAVERSKGRRSNRYKVLLTSHPQPGHLRPSTRTRVSP